MCGIFGGINIADPQATLQQMASILKHRGPDDDGFFVEPAVALGQVRLSIIDLSSGHQPMVSSNSRCVIVFNGEIYNYQEIHAELSKRGHQFLTSSDTEVILNAYLEWGYACLERFNGMFAFALWDKALRKLWVVRDRLGKKPLYYWFGQGGFYFASEAKALWRLPFFRGSFDLKAIDEYLTFRYVPGQRTFYNEIKKLPAAHWIILNEKAEVQERKQWWSIPFRRDEQTNKSLDDLRDEFQELFTSAVRLRLIADVPLGAFLSSGIDSVSIASEMAKVSRPTLFTIGFGGAADEASAAGQIASELGGEHHIIRMEEADFDFFQAAVASMDEPYGDPIILPTYLLARKAARHVKVVLTGDGADETLGGYIHHVFFRNMPVLPHLLRRTLAGIIGAVPVTTLDRAFHYPVGMGTAGRARLLGLLKNYSEDNSFSSYMHFATLFSNEDKAVLYSKEFANQLIGENDEFRGSMAAHFSRIDISVFDKALQWDLLTWFPEQTLMKFDRLTMANSIEGRCPYADHRLVEFFLRLPLRTYKELCDNKRIVRGIYQPNRAFLPKKKIPFYLPMHHGFNMRLKKFQDEVLESSELSKYRWFDPLVINNLRERRAHSPLLIDKQIMNLVVLFYWLRNHR